MILFAGDLKYDDRNSVTDDVGRSGVIVLASQTVRNRGIGETLNILAVTFACKRYALVCIVHSIYLYDCICVLANL